MYDLDLRPLCDEYAFEWGLCAQLDKSAILEYARELATCIVLNTELENSALREHNEALAAELRRLRELRTEASDRALADVNAALAEADRWCEKYYEMETKCRRLEKKIASMQNEIARLTQYTNDCNCASSHCGY